MAIGVINCEPNISKVLVICPASLKINWSRELSKWLVPKRLPSSDGKTMELKKPSIGIADGQCFPSTDVVICNYDVIHKWPKKTSCDWDLIILDEFHKLKSEKTRRSRFILGYRARKEGEQNVAPIPAKRKIGLTGTPISNKTIELYPLISYLDPVTWNNRFQFGVRYCDGKRTETGRKYNAKTGQWEAKYNWDFDGSSHLSELQEKLRSGLMVRRLKRDVLKDLPPKRRSIIELPADGCEHVIKAELRGFQEAMDEDEADELAAAVELAKASDDPAHYDAAVARMRKGMSVPFNEISKLRHDTALAKVQAAVDYIKELMEEDGSKKIIFAHHVGVIDRLMTELKEFNPVRLTGDMNGPQKQASVDKFQKDPRCLVFLGNLQAAGVGITLTAATHVIFVEFDWVPGNNSQCEDRAHRIGQKDSVLVTYLVLAGSLDANMAKTVVRKQNIIDQALDKVRAESELDQSPVTRRNNETLARKDIDRMADCLTPEQIWAIHQGLKMLAGVCNGAKTLDGQGFGRFDAVIGKSLGEASFLSAKQAAIGFNLCRKYARQIPPAILEKAGIKTEKET